VPTGQVVVALLTARRAQSRIVSPSATPPIAGVWIGTGLNRFCC
jgi:hypothetical protein